jgi:hypothetical protein
MNSQDSTDPIGPPHGGNSNPDLSPAPHRPPETTSAFGYVLSFLRRSATIFKMAGTAVLILLLLIPLSMVRSVLHERLGRRNEVVANITSSWGREQRLVGPVLIVPYRYAVKSWKEKPVAEGKTERVEVVGTALAKAYFLLTYLAGCYLYKRSNRLWRFLIKHRLVPAVWRPLVELTRLRHLAFRRRLAATPQLEASPGFAAVCSTPFPASV